MQNHEHDFEQNQEEGVDSIVSWCKPPSKHYYSVTSRSIITRASPGLLSLARGRH